MVTAIGASGVRAERRSPVANGIYLSRMTVRGHDGSVQSMGVRKMLVLR